MCEQTAIQTEQQSDRTTYIGETSRNLYTRGKEHEYNYGSITKESFMREHQAEQHDSQPPRFTAKVTGRFGDCLTRQVAEGVAIRRCQTAVLNSKSEWHQPALWRIRSEIERGYRKLPPHFGNLMTRPTGNYAKLCPSFNG